MSMFIHTESRITGNVVGPVRELLTPTGKTI
jgi:hypothetical protein